MLNSLVKAESGTDQLFDYFCSSTSFLLFLLLRLVRQGKLKPLHTTLNGIENAPLALAMLFDGKNNGKMQCRLVSDQEARKEVEQAGKAKL